MQGLALSLCAYLYRATHEQQYLDWANTIYKSFLIPMEQSGVTRYEDGGPFFEEHPTRIPSRVLNGAILTMIMIHDYAQQDVNFCDPVTEATINHNLTQFIVQHPEIERIGFFPPFPQTWLTVASRPNVQKRLLFRREVYHLSAVPTLCQRIDYPGKIIYLYDISIGHLKSRTGS